MLTNFDCLELVTSCLNQNEFLHLAGQGCLLLSHLVHGNLQAQRMFATPVIIDRMVFLSDFNQLINESDPESSIQGL